MKISQINNTNFRAKQRFLDENALINFQNIKKKIGKDSIIYADNMFWRSRVGYLVADDVIFANTKPVEVIMGKSKIEINDNGSIKISKKPFFKTKLGLIRKLEEYLACFDNMYEINKYVEKNYVKETGYIDETDGKAYITKREWARSK